MVDSLNLDSKLSVNSSNHNYITVFTDASYCAKTKAWGIGVWLKDCNTEVAITQSFGGKGDFNNIIEVESFGLHCGIQLVRERNPQDKILTIQCDCLGAFNNFNQDIIKNDLKLKVCKFKHVKAHTTHKTARSTVNRIVDSLAKSAMRGFKYVG